MAASEELRTPPDLERTSTAKKRKSEDRQESKSPAPTEASRESSAEQTSESADESSASDSEPASPPKKIKLEGAESYGDTKPACPPEKSKLDDADSKPTKDEGVPVKTESQADRFQALFESNTRLSISVSQLSQADKKHADANTENAASFTKLAEQLMKSVEKVREEEEAKQADRIAKLEATVHKYEAARGSQAAFLKDTQARSLALDKREKDLREQERDVHAGFVNIRNMTAAQSQTTRPSVYDRSRLDMYGMDRVPQLLETNPYYKKLTTQFGQKASAFLACQPRDEHPPIPPEILQSGWDTQPIEHWYGELDEMWKFLCNLPKNCKEELLDSFFNHMRPRSKDDPEKWLDEADEALERLMGSIESNPARSGYQVKQELAKKSTRIRPVKPTLLLRRRLRRFRALRRWEILTAMLAGDMRSKGYRVARSQARLFADEHDFAEFD